MQATLSRGPVELKSVRVLSVSPVAEDHVALSRMLAVAHDPNGPALTWALHPATSIESAKTFLDTLAFDIVVSERDLAPDTWKDVLRNISALRDPPFLVVTSRLADDYLWAEALNLGAWDVLAKPFDASEVARVLLSASVHRDEQRRMRRRRIAYAED